MPGTATARRPSPSQIAVRAHVVRAKGPPNFTIPWSGSIGGGRLPTICRFGGRLVQMRSGESRGWRPPPLTKWSRAGLVSGDGEGFTFAVAIFVAARLRPRAYRTTATHHPHRRRELARQLNHWPASATNE